MYAYDGGNYIYFTPSQTGFVYRGNILTGQMEGFGYIPIAQNTSATQSTIDTMVGNRMEVYHTDDGATFIWIWRLLATENYRCWVFY